MNSLTVKIALLGAGSVGKSAITIRYVQGQFVELYDPTIEDMYRKIVTIDDSHFMLEITDTAGTESFMAMRDLYIKNAQGFVLVYSITSKSTFSEIRGIVNQIMSVKDYAEPRQIPLVIVGNKCDLEHGREVLRDEGEKLAREFEDAHFMEASAKTQLNVDSIFEECMRQILRKVPNAEQEAKDKKAAAGARKKNKTCIIL